MEQNDETRTDTVRANMITLLNSGLLCVSGPDAKKFLQGQITYNLEKLTPQLSTLAAHCNPTGKIQSLFRIAVDTTANYFLILPEVMLTYAIEDFKKYALFSKVSLAIQSQIKGFGITGNEAIKHLAEILGAPAILNLHEQATFFQDKVFVCRSPGYPARFEIYLPEQDHSALLSILSQHTEIKSATNWDLLAIEAGNPVIYPATRNILLPHYLNLIALNAVSFDKGCYLGQEIIARMQYKGKIKKQLYCAHFHGSVSPQPNDPVFTATNPERVGIVVNSAPATVEQHRLLVSLETKYQDTPLCLLSPTGPPLTIVKSN